MKISIIIYLLLIVGLAYGQKVSHSFVCTDYSQGKVFIVDESNQIVWEYPAKHCNDIWVLDNGNLLFNDGNSVKEVNRDKQIIWEYTSKSDIYACQRLSDGNTLVGECTAGRLLEINPEGKIVKSVQLLKNEKEASSGYMRNARKLENGNYLLAHYHQDKVSEYDKKGEIAWEAEVKGGPHSVARLPDGNTLVACTDHNGDPGMIELNRQKEIVWQVGKEELPGISLKFVAGFQRLDNGNTVLTNWLGHNHLGESAHVVEITRDKKVVWKYDFHDQIQTISSIFLLDTNQVIGH
jgi:hypothetical protein